MRRDVSEELGDWFYLFGISVLVLTMLIFILCYGHEDLNYKIDKAFSEEYNLFIDGKEVFGNSNPMYRDISKYKVIVDNDKRVVTFETLSE